MIPPSACPLWQTENGNSPAQRCCGDAATPRSGTRPRLSQGAISDYLRRAQRAGLAWPLPDDVDDVALEALLFRRPPDVPGDQRPVPDWAAIHREMRGPNGKLALLWDEHRAEPADRTARGEGRLARLMTTLERTRLLIIDDWGPEPLTAEQRRDLLEIIDDSQPTEFTADHAPGACCAVA